MFNRPLMLVGKAESIQLFLALEPQARGEFAADLCREAIGETFDEANDDIAPWIDWRDRYFAEDCNMSMLHGREGRIYCLVRAAAYAAIALTYVFEARDKQAASPAPSADSGLLLLRALEAAMLGDAALSWVDMLELEVGKLSFTEDVKRRKIKKGLRESTWYREGYPARSCQLSDNALLAASRCGDDGLGALLFTRLALRDYGPSNSTCKFPVVQHS